MTLCGVLKDVLLVCASIAIWGTPVTALQIFGYSIALCGMIYYKLGADNIKSFFAELTRQWAEYGVKHPAQRKVVVFFAVLFTIALILGGLAPTVGYDTKSAPEWFPSILGFFGGGVVGSHEKAH